MHLYLHPKLIEGFVIIPCTLQEIPILTSWDISFTKLKPEIFSKYCHINIVTAADTNISYEITDVFTYNLYVLQNNSVYLNGIDVID